MHKFRRGFRFSSLVGKVALGQVRPALFLLPRLLRLLLPLELGRQMGTLILLRLMHMLMEEMGKINWLQFKSRLLPPALAQMQCVHLPRLPSHPHILSPYPLHHNRNQALGNHINGLCPQRMQGTSLPKKPSRQRTLPWTRLNHSKASL